MFRVFALPHYSRKVWITLAIIAAIFLWGWITSLSIREESFTWNIPEWTGTDKSISLILISDLHLSPDDESLLLKIVSICDAQQPDAVLLLGDFPSGSNRSSAMAPSVYAPLLAQCKAPVYAVLGNHDTYYGWPAIQKELEKAGIRVFNPDSTTITGKNGAVTQLGGVGDIVSRRSMVIRDGVPKRECKDMPYILMSHSHNIAPLIPDGVNLTVSGHTHGGQICLPGGRPLGDLIGKIPHNDVISGLQYIDGHPILITRGIGYSLLPIRIYCPPQIICLKLTAPSVK